MALERTAATLLVLISLAFCVIAARDLTETTPLSSVPLAQIEVPAGYELQEAFSAKGYQYYTFNGTAWLNNNASAVLKSLKNNEVAYHFYLPTPDSQGGQPTWEALRPSGSNGLSSSKVTGKALADVIVRTDSIPWVLLEATQSTGDKAYFGSVDYIQRYNTKHGLAPKSTKGARKGDIVSSRYTANYAFYVLTW